MLLESTYKLVYVCVKIVFKFDYRFNLHFRKSIFGLEYTGSAGLEECTRFIADFRLTKDEILLGKVVSLGR